MSAILLIQGISSWVWRELHIWSQCWLCVGCMMDLLGLPITCRIMGDSYWLGTASAQHNMMIKLAFRLGFCSVVLTMGTGCFVWVSRYCLQSLLFYRRIKNRFTNWSPSILRGLCPLLLQAPKINVYIYVVCIYMNIYVGLLIVRELVST